MRNAHQLLVVEDEFLVYEALSYALKDKKNLETRYAGDGEKALSMLAEGTPDLALIDVLLPKVSGMKVAERAAAQGAGVILMSGHPVVTGKGAAGYDFPLLIKPFRITRLADRLDALLSEAVRLRQAADRAIDRAKELARAGGAKRGLAEAAAAQRTGLAQLLRALPVDRHRPIRLSALTPRHTRRRRASR